MDKNFDNNLNSWFSAILGLNAIFTLIAVGYSIWNLSFAGSTDPLWYSIYDIAVQILFIFGCIKLFFASRVGFYVIVFVCLLNAMVGGWLYYHSEDNGDAIVQQIVQASSLRMIWSNIGKIIFLLLLMLLRDKGKNAYQVLWNTKH